jgi:hypothetical protein
MGSRRLIALGLMCLPLLLLAGVSWLPRAAGGTASTIRFDLTPIPFQLELWIRGVQARPTHRRASGQFYF